MSISTNLRNRCDSKCELCSAENELQAYNVPPKTGETEDEQVAVCHKCATEVEKTSDWDVNHWRCLNDSAWNATPAVQVVAYRMLQHLNDEGWAQDLKEMMYMEDATREWAELGVNKVVHVDSNGNILQNGDTVTLIKDLNVKGSSLVAKRGTAVRRIRLDPNNANYIEGKVDGQHIVILTQYVKK